MNVKGEYMIKNILVGHIASWHVQNDQMRKPNLRVNFMNDIFSSSRVKKLNADIFYERSSIYIENHYKELHVGD